MPLVTPQEKKSVALLFSVPTTSGKIYKHFVHATPNAVATVIAANYFDNLQCAVNDTIDCMCVHDGVGDRVTVKVLTVGPNFTAITTAINTDASGV